jgi:chemosensory pili system protein ChpB (putative protein-glutamate methylesterase)
MPGPDSTAETAVRAALLATQAQARRRIRRGLEERGVRVVVESDLHGFSSGVYPVDVLLVDLEGADDDALLGFERVLAGHDEPMVFVESGCLDGQLFTRLSAKLREAVSEGPVAPAPSELVPGDLSVWALGASFGGPQMLKRFLGAFDHAPEVAFVIAQHIGEGFTEVLANQLNRCGPVRVECAGAGMPLVAGCAYVAPVNERLRIDAQGRFYCVAEPEPHRPYRPSIDAVMAEVARRYGPRSGTIVFSGMGADGTAGACRIAAAGGTVWAQDAESCSIDSMPRSVAATGKVSHIAAPEQLAAAFSRRRHREAANRSA